MDRQSDPSDDDSSSASTVVPRQNSRTASSRGRTSSSSADDDDVTTTDIDRADDVTDVERPKMHARKAGRSRCGGQRRPACGGGGLRCELHPDRRAELFCATCRMLSCCVCATVNHPHRRPTGAAAAAATSSSAADDRDAHLHECVDVGEVAFDWRQQLHVHIRRLTTELRRCRDVLAAVDEGIGRVRDDSGKAEAAVNSTYDDLARRLAADKAQLLDDLETRRNAWMKGLQQRRADAQTASLRVDATRRALAELAEYGSDEDVVRRELDKPNANDFQDEFRLDVPFPDLQTITFKPSEVLRRPDNVVGQLVATKFNSVYAADGDAANHDDARTVSRLDETAAAAPAPPMTQPPASGRRDTLQDARNPPTSFAAPGARVARTWLCEYCTLINAEGDLVCQACHKVPWIDDRPMPTAAVDPGNIYHHHHMTSQASPGHMFGVGRPAAHGGNIYPTLTLISPINPEYCTPPPTTTTRNQPSAPYEAPSSLPTTARNPTTQRRQSPPAQNILDRIINVSKRRGFSGGFRPARRSGDRRPVDVQWSPEDCAMVKWRCESCTYENHPAAETCEMCDARLLTS